MYLSFCTIVYTFVSFNLVIKDMYHNPTADIEIKDQEIQIYHGIERKLPYVF
jgi:hypothetical protein